MKPEGGAQSTALYCSTGRSRGGVGRDRVGSSPSDVNEGKIAARGSFSSNQKDCKQINPRHAQV